MKVIETVEQEISCKILNIFHLYIFIASYGI